MRSNNRKLGLACIFLAFGAFALTGCEQKASDGSGESTTERTAVDDLADSASAAARDLKSAAGTAAESAKRVARDAKKVAEEKIDEAKVVARDAAKKALDRADEAVDTARTKLDEADHAAVLVRGRAAFEAGKCAKCHMDDGTGSERAPNLTDAEWIHCDGTIEGIMTVLLSGVPREKLKDADRPYAMKPATTFVPKKQMDALAAYVLSLQSP